MNRLAGKIAIVTGGAVGIGRACVERMAEEGAKVAIFDILEAEGNALTAELSAKGREVAFWKINVADEAAMKSAIDASSARFGGLHVMVNNAGISGAAKPTDQVTEAGMDTFIAGLKVGRSGRVIGIDMTVEQLHNAESLRNRAGFSNVEFMQGYIEVVALPEGTADAVISNGVINLATDKARVFAEVARLLKPGGHLVISDIVTDTQLPEKIVSDSTLWAACIGGAALQYDYHRLIAAAGLKLVKVEDNPAYQFISANARGASRKFGVKSISLLAIKP